MSEYNDTNQGLGSVYDTPDQKEIARLDRKLALARERIKTLEEALEWLFKNYDPDDFLEERNGDYRLLIGINNYFAATPLEVIQNAMKSALQSPPSQE